MQAAGIPPQRIPVLSFSIAEDELRKLPLRDMVGDYAAWDYFQSIDRPENREFVQRFKASYGADRVTSDVIEAAYYSVRLWAQAVVEAESEEVANVLKAIRRQSLNAPEGIVSVDDETQHTWRPVYVGQIRADGQFDLVWSSEKPVRPIPYPNSRSHAEWDAFLDRLVSKPGVAGQTPVPRNVAWRWRCAWFSLFLETNSHISAGRSLAQAAGSTATHSFPIRSGATSHDLAIGFVCTFPDQHHDPVGDLVSLPLADPLRRADGHHLLPVQPILEKNRSSGAAGDLRCQDDPA